METMTLPTPESTPELPPAPEKKKMSTKKKALLAAAGFMTVMAIAGGGSSSGSSEEASSSSPTTVTTVAAGRIAEPASSSSASATKEAMVRWANGPTDSIIDDVVDASQRASSAAQEMDIVELVSACLDYGDAATRGLRHLPTPDPALTSALRDVYTNAQMASGLCREGAANLDGNKLTLSASYVGYSTEALRRATTILERYL